MDDNYKDQDTVDDAPYIVYGKHPPKYIFEGMLWEREPDFMRFTADYKSEVWRSKSVSDYFVPFPPKTKLFKRDCTKWKIYKTIT